MNMKSRSWVLVGCLWGLVMCSEAVAQEVDRAADKSYKYSDDKFDFTIVVSPPWKSARLQDYTVPGVARAAFAGVSGSSIVVFVQEPGKDFTPRFILDASVKGIEEGLGAATQTKEVREVAGKQAMWLVVHGKGTGSAIDGKNDVPTTQHWVAIPREKDVIVVLLTCPTLDFQAHAKSFEQSLKSLVVGGKQTATQRDSK